MALFQKGPSRSKPLTDHYLHYYMVLKINSGQLKDIHTGVPLIISSQSQMVGDFIFSTDVKIDGYVEGNIVTTKSVVIGENGHLKGNLKCNSLRVYGCFEGASEAAESTCLYATAVYTGRLDTLSVVVSSGSVVNALINIEMFSPDQGKKRGMDNPSPFQPAEGEDKIQEGPDSRSKPGRKQPSFNKSFLLSNLKK